MMEIDKNDHFQFDDFLTINMCVVKASKQCSVLMYCKSLAFYDSQNSDFGCLYTGSEGSPQQSPRWDVFSRLIIDEGF